MDQARAIAEAWCESRGDGWGVTDELGRGGTAPVYSITSPHGELALKLYDQEFSEGYKGAIEEERINSQVSLGEHGFPHLVQVYGGGRFLDRLFLVMNRANGSELEKVLHLVPRNKIRTILDQVCQAVQFLRSKELCHRDIKSANIFISDTFDHCTLLDLSVTRSVHDPVGIGTDHDGQLPVVATARYSPPEYLFRLIDPGYELWNALDIYQLGGLAHDLIMRKPLFSEEYAASKSNRYRFAYIVSTTIPEIDAADVDADLVFLAKRALDKDWNRRSLIDITEFRKDSSGRTINALAAFGIHKNAGVIDDQPSIQAGYSRLSSLRDLVDAGFVTYLRAGRITPKHQHLPVTSPREQELSFSWNVLGDDNRNSSFEFKVRLTLEGSEDSRILKIHLSLSNGRNTPPTIQRMEVPDQLDSTVTEDGIIQTIVSGFEHLVRSSLHTSGA